MACTLGCFSFLSYFHIKPYLIQTHVAFKVLRKKMPRCGLATPRRNSTRVLDVMLVTTPTTMFLIVSSSKRCRAQVFGTFNIRTSANWLLLPSLVSRMQRTWQQSWLVRTSSSWPRTGCTTVLQALRRAMSISSLGRIRRWRTSWLLSTNRSSRLTRQILKLMFFLKDIMQTLSGPSCFANFFEGNQLPEPLLFVNVALREMQEAPRLLPTAESALQVKREKVNHVWKHLKRCPVTTVIELDSPSPAKGVRPSAPASSLPSLPAMPSCPVMNPGNAELGLLEHEEQEAIDLENDMVSFMDEIDGMPPVGEGPDED